MLSNFLVAVEAVFPVFLVILIGVAARRFHLMTDEELRHANGAIFKVMFPFLMFYNIYSADFSGAVIPEYFAFCLIMTMVIYFLYFGTTLLIEKNNFNRGAMIQAMYRGNLVLIGLPIMENLMGQEAVGLTTFIIAIIVPTYNVLAVITLELFRGGDIHFWSLFKKIISNPMIIGVLIGVVFVALGIELPPILEKPISQVAGATTPVALLVMGASFRFGSIKENLRNLIICVSAKLLIGPALGTTVGYLFGFRGIPMALLVIVFGAPCAVAGYTMAQQMDSNGELSAGCLIFSALFSSITICLWLFIFMQLGAF